MKRETTAVSGVLPVLDALIPRIMADRRVQGMRGYVHHGSVSTLEHCERVARFCYRFNRRLHLHADETALLTGAMLHDFYLYDWHQSSGAVRHWHGFRHAELARRNAVECFGVSPLVQDIIGSHMWPLNLTKLPRSREAWIVTLADKCCAVKESLFMRKK